MPPSRRSLPSITTPDKVESSIGTLEYKDGAPSKETVAKAYDYLDLMHGVEAFVNAYQGASVAAIFKGMEDAGVPNNTALIFSELMDAKSLFLTANADTIYFWVNLDVTKGPIVVETPPLALGVVDDMWFQWVTDFGLPGPDRGEGGKYLFVPPGYKGELPGSGYFVQKMRTTRATMLGRSFLEKNDPKPVVALIKKTLKIYPYLPGGYGTSIGSALEGKATLARTPDHKLDWAFLRPEEPAKFIEGTGKVMNTIPPNDFSYFEMINDLVQKEPVGALDPEIMGSLAAIGIVKGKPFNPDARMKKILTDAAAIGTAAARTVDWRPRPAEGFSYYPNSAWIDHALGRRLQLRNAAARGQCHRRHHRQPAHRRPHAQLAHGDVLLRHLHHPGDDHAADRHRLAVHWRVRGLQRRILRRRQDLQGDAAAKHPGGEVLVLDRLRQPDALDARHAAALPARRQPELSDARRRSRTPTAPRPCISARASRQGSATATGSRPFQERAGARSCASTARLNRSSRRRGGRARLSLSTNGRKVRDTFHHSRCGTARTVARLVSKQPRGTVAPRRISLCLGKCAGSPALTCQIARLADHWGTSVKHSWGVE